MSSVQLLFALLSLGYVQYCISCKPCSKSESTHADLNKDNGWSQIGNNYCSGSDNNDESGVLTFSFEIKQTSNYTRNLQYSIAIYNDDKGSYPMIEKNESMSCKRKLIDYSIHSKIFEFADNNRFRNEFFLQSNVSQQWWAFVAYCDDSENMNDITFPMIDYNVSFVSFSNDRERNECGESKEKKMEDQMIGFEEIFSIVAACIAAVAGVGFLIWWFLIKKRKMPTLQSVGIQALVNDDSDGDNDENDNDIDHKKVDQDQLQKYMNDKLNDDQDVQLQTA